MDILNDIMGAIKTDAPVTEVRRGLHWTAVVSRNCGLASTLPVDSCAHEEDGGKEGSFTDMSALELARYCRSENTDTASLGLAAINSLIDVDLAKCADVDGLKLVYDVGKGKNISIIGHFPFLDDLARTAANLWIIEKRPRSGDIPEESGQEYIARSDIVVISSTTLINHTLPGILARCSKRCVTMLLGPSTPMSETLFDHGIDILSGSVVTDRETLLKLVSEGVSYMRIKKSGATRFVDMVRDMEDIRSRIGAA